MDGTLAGVQLVVGRPRRPHLIGRPLCDRWMRAQRMGFLSSPGRFQVLALDHPNILTSTYPTVMIPAFGVPSSIILHGVSLWQLGRLNRADRR